MACVAADCAAATVATGKNWGLAIESIECAPADSRLLMGARIRYLGSKGLVEAPVAQLVDGAERQFLPRSLVWKSGSKPLAQLMAAGGVGLMQPDDSGEVQLRFDLKGASGNLRLEFGDIEAFSLARKAAPAAGSICEHLLRPDQLQAPRKAASPQAVESKSRARIYRMAYPCAPQAAGPLRGVEAQHPPYLPTHLLLFGRGFLPNARRIELPMGKVPARSYAYLGADELDAIDEAARRALLQDFSAYRTSLVSGLADGGAPGKKHFAFNWGMQKTQSGNEAYAIGIYPIRPCPK